MSFLSNQPENINSKQGTGRNSLIRSVASEEYGYVCPMDGWKHVMLEFPQPRHAHADESHFSPHLPRASLSLGSLRSSGPSQMGGCVCCCYLIPSFWPPTSLLLDSRWRLHRVESFLSVLVPACVLTHIGRPRG